MCLDSSSGVEETDVDSISVIDDEMNTTVVLGDHGVTERNKGVESHRVAEMWRAGIAGRYRKDEVNLTKIGAAPLGSFRKSLCVNVSFCGQTEEADHTIGMAADWLELDAPDIWVRHDSELVSIPLLKLFFFRIFPLVDVYACTYFLCQPF